MTARFTGQVPWFVTMAQHWRNLRWAPPVLAATITVEVAMGGSNGWVARPAAVLANMLMAGMILAAVEPSSRLWGRMRVPFVLCVAALLWATIPWLLPRSVASLLDVPVHPAPDRMLPELAEAVSRLLLVMAACAVAYRRHTAGPIVLWLAIAGGLYAGWMSVTPLPWRFLAGTEHGRFSATIGNWNAAGAFFGMVAVLCLTAILTRDGVRRRGAHWLFALPLAAALSLCIATQSRSAFTLTAVALVVGLFWNMWSTSRVSRGRHATAMMTILAMVTLAVAYIGAEALFPRYRVLSADSLSRWDIVTTYAGYTLDSPFWGFGPGSFFEINRARLASATALRFWDFGAAHNAPLQIALEDGWPALLLLAGGVAVIGHDIVRRPWTAEAIGLAGALTIIAGASLVDIAWNVPAIGAFGCVLLGALWGGRPATLARHLERDRIRLMRSRS